MLDVIIVGAGPIGLACGIELQKRGLSYLIIEKGVLVNSLYHYPDNMTFFSTSDKLEIGGVPFVSHNPKPTRQEALEYYRRVAENFQLKIHLYEEINDIAAKEESFAITTTRGTYACRKLIIASGFYDLPNLLGIPGEELPKVRHYYDDPHPYFRQRIVVVGARNSAVDAALECWRKGAEVSMIVREDSISERVKYWVRPDIENRIKEGSIKAYFNAEIQEITNREVIFMQEGREHRIDNDFVLAMTGYQPDFEMLRKAGVKIREDEAMKPVYDPLTMETNVPGLYLAGVICGGLETQKWFIENSREHAVVIADQLARGEISKS